MKLHCLCVADGGSTAVMYVGFTVKLNSSTLIPTQKSYRDMSGSNQKEAYRFYDIIKQMR